MKKPSELLETDLVLGYNATRQHVPTNVKLVSKTNVPERMTHIIFKRGEILAPITASIPCHGGPISAKILGDPCQPSKMVETFQGGEFLSKNIPTKKLTPQESKRAFIEGVLFRKIPGIDKNVIRIPNASEEELQKFLRMLLLLFS